MYVHVQLFLWVPLTKTYEKDVSFENFGILCSTLFRGREYNDLNIGKLLRLNYICTICILVLKIRGNDHT